MQIEKAPEVAARDQPNSWIIGLKKTPKLLTVPQASVMMQKQAATMI